MSTIKNQVNLMAVVFEVVVRLVIKDSMANNPNHQSLCRRRRRQSREQKSINQQQQHEQKHRQQQPKYYEFDQMPEYLRFNQWIHSGYRSPQLSTIECLKSCFELHNETMNIWTHLLSILYILYNFRTIFITKFYNSKLIYFHIISCLSSWIGSLLYHIFMNHRLGRKIYYPLLKIDMFGIWITQTFGALTTIQASLIMFDESFRLYFSVIYLAISMVVLYECLQAKESWQRSTSFSILFLMRLICFMIRLRTHYNPNQMSLLLKIFKYRHIIGQEIWPIIGAIIASTKIPERFFNNGQFDYFLNSHNIMHCLVVMGGLHMHWSFIDDIQFFIN